MKTITLKDIPDQLHAALKERARENGRSLNREAIACLESVVLPQPFDPKAFLEEVRELRKEFRGETTNEFIQEAKRWGRP